MTEHPGEEVALESETALAERSASVHDRPTGFLLETSSSARGGGSEHRAALRWSAELGPGATLDALSSYLSDLNAFASLAEAMTEIVQLQRMQRMVRNNILKFGAETELRYARIPNRRLRGQKGLLEDLSRPRQSSTGSFNFDSVRAQELFDILVQHRLSRLESGSTLSVRTLRYQNPFEAVFVGAAVASALAVGRFLRDYAARRAAAQEQARELRIKNDLRELLVEEYRTGRLQIPTQSIQALVDSADVSALQRLSDSAPEIESGSIGGRGQIL